MTVPLHKIANFLCASFHSAHSKEGLLQMSRVQYEWICWLLDDVFSRFDLWSITL